ncbi:hypothetical protein BGI37_06655 [Snodgrassella alvi]|nr:hypothetical protein BGI37_10710 [Snodgrassella alvi]PIT25452.1 hypothetical protein BGI37_06655 [Snodgrassella alvi]
MGWFVIDMVSTMLATEDNKQQKDFSIDEEFCLIYANSRRQLYQQIKKNVNWADGLGYAFFNSETRREISNDSSGAYERCWDGDGPSWEMQSIGNKENIAFIVAIIAKER